mmetsp:Transcript_39814/g.96060  ORF Transcript_39814/g.96060 Transcript_39814/m.96060 type:complete len:430 (-) Transcript_39814:158-1447(-)
MDPPTLRTWAAHEPQAIGSTPALLRSLVVPRGGVSAYLFSEMARRPRHHRLARQGNPPASEFAIEHLEEAFVSEEDSTEQCAVCQEELCHGQQRGELGNGTERGLPDSQEQQGVTSQEQHDIISLDAFPPPPRLVKMPCEHRFHSKCLRPWLRERNTCPVCRCQVESVCHRYNRGHSRDFQGPQSEPSKLVAGDHSHPVQDLGGDMFVVPMDDMGEAAAHPQAEASRLVREREPRGAAGFGVGARGLGGRGVWCGMPDLSSCSRRIVSTSLLQHRQRTQYSPSPHSHLLFDSANDDCLMRSGTDASPSAESQPLLNRGTSLSSASRPSSFTPLIAPQDQLGASAPGNRLCSSSAATTLKPRSAGTPAITDCDAQGTLFADDIFHGEREVSGHPAYRGGVERAAKRSRARSTSPKGAWVQAKRRRSKSPL